MIGLEFFRRKRRMTRRALADRAGVTVDTIRNYTTKGISDSVSVDMLLALAGALEITLDELLGEYDGRNLTTMDRPVYSSVIDSPKNIVNTYRIDNNLRFEELAARLGLGDRESARSACRRETAREEHILRLCRYEGMDYHEFVDRYDTDR